MSDSSTQAPGGGSFLNARSNRPGVLTCEDLGEEQRSIARMVDEFWHQEIEPALGALHAHVPGTARQLLRKAAALGLTSIHVPERCGGLALDLPSIMVVIEHLARDASYLGWHLGHAGIGMLPIVLYGSADQQQRYLARMMSADLLGAYALTEPHSGTDALASRTRADLTPDGGHYVLNGQKMWITNGGEADVFIVFAKVNGDSFTAFIVERSFGVRSGAREHKMGLEGTSTTALYFDDVRVPVANVLGEVGRGHVIAFNILNIARLELGPNMIGAAKAVIAASLAYAATRQAFGSPIVAFGAIQHKIADCVVRLFATESATWRVVGLVADGAATRPANGAPDADAIAHLAAFEEFAAECSIVKVVSSEMLEAVADHGVQIHGGYGYHRDYYVERAYRDARINRIFEGTNEINRLIIPGTLARRAVRAGRSLLGEAADAFNQLPALAAATPARDDAAIVAGVRTLALVVLAAVHRRTGDALREPQEIVMALADIIIESFVMESVHLRARKLHGMPSGELASAVSHVYQRDALPRVALAATTALSALLDKDDARTALAAVRALTTAEPCDTIALRRVIAAHAQAAAKYPF
jgi:alkylation response protein AidB-like acyl-CoA dehydrogenase